jgi:hypothetical protein
MTTRGLRDRWPTTRALRAEPKKEFIMRTLLVSRLAGVLLALAGIAIASPSTALAAPPSNDNFAAATVIGSLPFTDTVDNTLATTEPGEPFAFCGIPQTVWYSFTPTVRTAVHAQATGISFSGALVAAWQSVSPGLAGLSPLGCGGAVDFVAEAGTTYYLQAGNDFSSSGGTFQLDLSAIPPPPNDDFANATQITTLPFNDTVADAIAAGVEPGEPLPSCRFPAPTTGTVWYSFTPTVSGSFAMRQTAGFQATLAAYTGGSLTGLSEVACHPFDGNPLVFRADTGTTYSIQASGGFPGGSLSFNFDIAPQPVANFGFSPFNPSIFDTVQFFDFSSDPAGAGFQAEAWDFGDGATGTGCCPTHRYATDSDYTVKLDVTTFDGRTAATSQVVQVRTHDVAITKFTVPVAARAGQTRQISVGIRNTRYPENVDVQLFKSVPGGFQFVGDLTLPVPVRPSSRTTAFDFSYTFTDDDAAVGKVTFKAVATILGANDALPADNEAIASPTKVND